MNSKSNQILIGIIFVLLGVFSLTQNFINLNFGGLTMAGGGMALILLYKTKKKSWSLVLGSYLFFLGSLKLITSIFNLGDWLHSLAVAGMFFLVPGFIFLILFYDKNKRGLLVPACILIWLGIFTMAFSIPGFFFISHSMFFICFGMSFISMYLLGRTFMGRCLLYIGLGFVGFGCILLIGFSGGIGLLFRLGALIPSAIILIGILIIVRAMWKNKSE